MLNILIILKILPLLRLQNKRKGNPQKKEEVLKGIAELIAWKREALFVMMNLQLLRDYFIIFCGIKKRVRKIKVLRKPSIIFLQQLFKIAFQLEGKKNDFIISFNILRNHRKTLIPSNCGKEI